MVTLNYLLNNEEKINKITNKITNLSSKIKNKNFYFDFFISMFLLSSSILASSFHQNVDISNFYLFIILMLSSINFIFNITTEKSIFSRLISSFIPNKKDERYLKNLFYEKNKFISKKYLNEIEKIEKDLTPEDIEFIDNSMSFNLSFNKTVYYELFIEKYIENNDIETLKKNRMDIFKIIDRISYEGYQKNLLDLYLKKINKTEIDVFDSDILNKVNKQLDNEKTQILNTNTSKTIKQI